MVISNIIGGLGNQMFQYAAARSLSLAHGQRLYLDVGDFEGYRLHYGFELNRVFKGAFDLATEGQIEQILGWRGCRPVRKLLKRSQMRLFRGKGMVVEPHFEYWKGFLSLPSECYLAGYWQSEHYFKSAEDTIRSDFSFSKELSGLNRDIDSQIAQSNAVSVHIRRGDYASHAKTKAMLGTLPLSYYAAAIGFIADKVPQPQFFVFSDDIAWAKENLKITQPCQFIGHNQGEYSYIDMQLMSLCKHQIIANSSFSWWGAWLNSNVEKIVIAPYRWFANANDAGDLIPADWIKL